MNRRLIFSAAIAMAAAPAIVRAESLMKIFSQQAFALRLINAEIERFRPEYEHFVATVRQYEVTQQHVCLTEMPIWQTLHRRRWQLLGHW